MTPLSQQQKQEIASRARAAAATVADPEIPVITVEDLGVVQKITVDDKGYVTIGLTPTYSGCPAVLAIELAVQAALAQAGLDGTTERLLSPPWTTDFISDTGREKLRRYGIAPPNRTSGKGTLLGLEGETVACPQCGSEHTRVISQFGSTACKALYACEACHEPFDYFKCL